MRHRAAATCFTLALLAACTTVVSGHVGSPDVYFEGNAGPYRLLVAIRTPPVVPGVAGIEVRILEGDVRAVHVVPLRLTGLGAEFAPVPDLATPSRDDARFFTANLWMMTSGAWRVRITVDGSGGRHDLAVPVDAVASRTLQMPLSLQLVLAPLALFLIFGFISIVGASVGEAQTDPGSPVSAGRARRVLVSRVAAAVFVVVALIGGNKWWAAEASTYDRYIYKPLQLRGTLQADSKLLLNLHDPGWLVRRSIDDLVPDHGHPMHLFLIREPNLDRLLHLHPQQLEPGSFSHALPATDAGRYRLFGDIVHASGFPETSVTTLDLPATSGGAPTGDDSAVSAPAQFEANAVSTLPDGGRITWQQPADSLQARAPYILTFKVDDAAGQPAKDLELYMGMPGHAIVVKRDLSVFAHVHPSGTPPMASIALAAAGIQTSDTSPHAGHSAAMASLPPVVTFPYGFPSEGEYRVFVQVKRAGVANTGAFDVRVTSARTPDQASAR